MTFLNPFYLFGIIAGIIPFLIHLLHRRRLRVIEFSSLEFLKKIEGRRTRWFRIREMLLLVLRCLAIVLLAIAISRPVLRSTVFGAFSSHARTSAVFILDNSYSMGLKTKEGSSFDNAKGLASSIAKLLDKGDDASLVFASDVSKSVFENPVLDLPFVESAISGAELSCRATDFKPSVEMATAALERSKNLNKEIYLFTDMQRSGFESFARGAIHATKGERIYVFDAGSTGRPRNVSLDKLVLADPLLFEGGKVGLVATFTNHGPGSISIPLRSSLDGREMGVKDVSLPGGSSQAVELAFSVERAGLHHLRVDTGEDDLDTDNHRFLAFKIPGKMRVCLIFERQSGQRGYLETALSPEEGLSMFVPEAFSKGDMPSINLEKYPVIALLGVSSLNSSDVLRLVNFVQNGGGLLVTLSPYADVQFFNSVFLPKLAPMELQKREPLSNDRTFFLRISYCDYGHPIFSQFKDPKKGDLGIARVYQRVNAVARSGVIARFSDGAPFAVESSLGKGKVIVITMPLEGASTDLPLKAVYVPLIHRIFRYLSMGEETNCNINVGEKLSFPLSGLKQILCTPPSGKPFKIEPRIRSGRMYAEYYETESPGIYSITSGDSLAAYFAVNPISKESNIARAEEDEARSLLAELRPSFVKPNEKLGSSIFRVRLGIELTNPLIMLVLAILVAEMLIAGRFKRTTQT